MSIGGSSPLGTLLIQRLDAVLGHTTGQQSNIVTGARPDAVSQTAQAERNQAVQSHPARHPRELIEQTRQQGHKTAKETVRQSAQPDNRQAAIEALLRHTNSSATPSAPTTLGRAARTIIEIIERFPDGLAPLQGRQPIITGPRLQTLLQEPLPAAPPGSSLTGGPGKSVMPSPPQASQSPATTPTPALEADQLVHHLAQGLRATLQQSGMFYESQLAQLAFGKGHLDELRLQPQNTPPAAPSTPSTQTSQVSEATNTARNPETPNPESTSPQATSQQHHDSSHQALIRQQLDVLATQKFVWRGEALPNLPLEWHVEREQEHKGTPNRRETVHSQRWNSKLLMQLNNLGDIEFNISLNVKKVSLTIHASDASATLRPHLQNLNARLSAYGLSIEQLSLNTASTSTDASCA